MDPVLSRLFHVVVHWNVIIESDFEIVRLLAFQFSYADKLRGRKRSENRYLAQQQASLRTADVISVCHVP